jgi:hypothetical protein
VKVASYESISQMQNCCAKKKSTEGGLFITYAHANDCGRQEALQMVSRLIGIPNLT